MANIAAFEHLARMVARRHVVAADGADRYLPHVDRLAHPDRLRPRRRERLLPAGGTERTARRLSRANGARLYRRHVIPDYGHIDCIFGKHAARDVYPHVVRHLDAT